MNYKRLFVSNSIVFITFVTGKRREILQSNIGILRQSFIEAKNKYGFKIIAICVLKNHVHMLIKPANIDEYPLIIKEIKIYFSKNIDITTIKDYSLSKSQIQKGERDIWQRRYWEHTIVDKQDLCKHIDYIHFNPMKHYKIFPKDWPHSSFKKYVQSGYYEINWCNFDDKYKINKLDYE